MRYSLVLQLVITNVILAENGQGLDGNNNEKTSVHESLTFFDLTRGRADKSTSKLAHYELSVKGNYSQESIHYKDQEHAYYVQDYQPSEFLGELYNIEDLESFRLGFGLGEFDDSLFSVNENLSKYKLRFSLPHQGSELFVKCKDTKKDCIVDVGYLLAGWFSFANERSKRFERFSTVEGVQYANFGGEGFCKEHLYKILKFLPCSESKNRGIFSQFNQNNFFYGDYASINIVFNKINQSHKANLESSYEFRIEINNQFRENSINQQFNKVARIEKCPHINENSYIRLFSTNSEKSKLNFDKNEKYPQYNFNERSDWSFEDNDEKSFNLAFVKELFRLNRPLTYNYKNNVDQVEKDIEVFRYISKSNKDLANEVILTSKNYLESQFDCTFDLILTFSEYPVFSMIKVKSSQKEDKDYSLTHDKIELLMPLYRRPYHSQKFNIQIMAKEEIKITLPYAIFFRNYEEIEHEFERGVFLPGVPYYCKRISEHTDSDNNSAEILDRIESTPFVLVQEKQLDNTFVFTSQTFGTAFMYQLYVTFSFATMMRT